jgi:hypothetical protein
MQEEYGVLRLQHVARHRAVRINPDDLAEAGRQVLRLVAVVEAFAMRDEQSAVASEDEGRLEVARALHLRWQTPEGHVW